MSGHALSGRRQGTTLFVGRLAFTKGKHRWTHILPDAVDDLPVAIELELTKTSAESVVVVSVVAYLENYNEPVHREVVFGDDQRLDWCVSRLVRKVQRLRSPVDDAFNVAMAEIDRDGRVPLAWAVRAGDDPDWLQKAWNTTIHAHAMLDALKNLLRPGQTRVWPYTPWKTKAFPNQMCYDRFGAPGHRPLTVRSNDKRTADAIRRRVPTIPTVAELLAAQMNGER